LLLAHFGPRLARTLGPAIGAVALVVALTGGQARANGPHVGARDVFTGTAGPYQVTVRTAPVVGNMHLSIYVAQAVDAQPISNASVRVSGEGPQDISQIAESASATATLDQPGWYGVILVVKEVGDWRFTLTIDGPMGGASVDFPVKVVKASSVPWGLIVPAALALGLLVWWMLSSRRRKGGRPQGGRGG
jgi:hypothetical protein